MPRRPLLYRVKSFLAFQAAIIMQGKKFSYIPGDHYAEKKVFLIFHMTESVKKSRSILVVSNAKML